MICVDNLYTRGPREKKSLKRSCAVPHCTEKTLESLHGKNMNHPSLCSPTLHGEES